jgi:hypothetical protein
MNNTEILNTVDLNNAQTEELANTANVKAELSEDQLDNVNAGNLGDLEDFLREGMGRRELPREGMGRRELPEPEEKLVQFGFK